jgi:hypothetical protein
MKIIIEAGLVNNDTVLEHQVCHLSNPLVMIKEEKGKMTLSGGGYGL